MLKISTHNKKEFDDDLWLKNKDLSGDMQTYFIKTSMKTLWIRWRVVLFIGITCMLLLFIYHDRISTIIFENENECVPITEDLPYIKPIYSYCNSIDSEPPPSDEGQVSDSLYNLEMVHVLIRHGDRLMLHNLTNYEKPKISCDMKSDKRLYNLPDVKNFLLTMDKNANKKLENLSVFKYDLFPNQRECNPGDLTPEGVIQHVRNGLNFRKMYIDKWKLYKGEIDKEIVLYSTDKKRTFQSAIALISGFIPNLDIGQLNINAAENTDMCLKSHHKFPCHCPVITDFRSTQSHTIQQHLHTHEEDTFNALRSISKTMNINFRDVPLLSHIMDIGMVHSCHHISLPRPIDGSLCWNPKALHDVVKALNLNSERHLRKKKTKLISTLRALPLLNSIFLEMESKLNNSHDKSFVLYSGHDSTLDPMLIALNISDNVWPKYASRLVFELYSKKSANKIPSDYYLRFIYNGLDVTQKVIFCKDVTGQALKMCPFDNYKKFIRTEDGLVGFDLKTYLSACNGKLGII